MVDRIVPSRALYPAVSLYFLGLLLGFLLKFAQLRYGSVHPSTGAFLMFFLLGLLMLPAPPMMQAYQPGAFPLNAPTWSLFYETVANIIHALLFRRRSSTWLAVVTVLSALGMIFASFKLGTTGIGWKRVEILYGMPRVLFGYTCGILLYRVWKHGRFRLHAHPLVLAAVLLALFAVPANPHWDVPYGLVVTIVVLPLLLLASASSPVSERLMPAAGWLGTLSYSLYVLHVPLEENFRRIWVHVRHHDGALDAPWSGLLYTVIILAVALLIEPIYDLPVRSFLRRRLQGQRTEKARTPMGAV